MSDAESDNGSRDELTTYRQRIRAIDDEIMALVAERLEVAREIGRIKLSKGLPIKDFKVEKDVIERALIRAKDAGVYEDMADEFARLLIKYAVLAQDEFHSKSRAIARRDHRKILIVGGQGHMGLWLSEFFSSFGHDVMHCDHSTRAPQGTVTGAKGGVRFPSVETLDGATDQFDVICLATPISKTSAIIDQLATKPGRALVFDVCSLKTPIMQSLKAAEAKGLRITSIHPMFGPDVELLAGRNILFCASEHQSYVAEARTLFADTTAHLMDVPLDLHDKFMGYVLGLSHLINLVFARVLSESEIPFAELQKVASTTFNAQLSVTGPVTAENQDLYFEIQAENAFTPDLIRGIAKELAGYEAAICNHDKSAFKAFMDASRQYFETIKP